MCRALIIVVTALVVGCTARSEFRTGGFVAESRGDSAGNQTGDRGGGDDGPLCFTDWIQVPGNPEYGTPEFCVMRFEAKLEYDGAIVLDGNAGDATQYDWNTEFETANRVRFRAVSTQDGQPWVNVRRGENGAATGQGAIEACEELGPGFDLISNDEWQTIARDIAAQQANWVVDSAGDTVLNKGHTDDSPAQSCDASTEAVETDCVDSGGETNPAARRTHTLSNGEVIWDLSGNVWEWVKDDNTAEVFTGTQEYWSAFVDSDSDGVSDSDANAQTFAGPRDLTPAACTTPNNPSGCGFGYLYDGAAGAILRGGRWLELGWTHGVFSIILNHAPTEESASFGFRCVYRPG